MWSFLVDLVRGRGETRTVVLMDADEVGTARRYQLRPTRLLWVWGGSLVAIGSIVASLVAFTPLRTQIPGYGTETIEESARKTAGQLQTLQDSLAAQRQYVNRLRQLITGRVDSLASRGTRASEPSTAGRTRTDAESEGLETDSGPTVHGISSIGPSAFGGEGTGVGVSGNAVPGLSFPLPPPVENGFPTREFNAETGHFGIDVAVSEGEHIHAVGDGYVVWADWSQDGGNTIAVQHGGGYLSVYKHNRRLLKDVGDRVRAQEPIAVSGNTGEMTSGPHLHFELWRNGLVQGPASYIAEW